MAQMTLFGPSFGAPATSMNTGLGRGFSTPQQANVERPMQYQNLDAMALENLSKPKIKSAKPLAQAESTSTQLDDIFAPSASWKNYNTSMQLNRDYLYKDPNFKFNMENSKQKDQYLNRPKAGQALSTPWKPSQSMNSGNSAYLDFRNTLNSIRDEQDIYKQVSDPNFKVLSEEEIQAEAQKQFNDVWANKTWQDFYKQADPAARAKARQQIVDDIKVGKQSKTALGFFDRYQTDEMDKASAQETYERFKNSAPSGFESKLRQLTNAKKYFDSEEGKKRLEAGKKMLDFYGTTTNFADGTGSFYGENPDPVDDGSFIFDRVSGVLNAPRTEYQKRYAAEFEKRQSDPSKVTGMNREEHKKIRDLIMGDFNKSVGFTGKFTPYEFTDANVESTFQNLKRSPAMRNAYGNLSDEELRKVALKQVGKFNGGYSDLGQFVSAYGPTTTYRANQLKQLNQTLAKDQPFYSWI